MKIYQSLWVTAIRVLACVLVLGALPVNADHIMITRHFTGVWEKPDHESQGIVLQIIDQADDSNVGVAYWFTYAADLESAWFLAVGPIDGHMIDMVLYEASGVGFLEPDMPGDVHVEPIGTLTLDFRNCNQGHASFVTPDDVLGTGDFRIRRIASIYRSRCSGGISDNTPHDAKPLKLEVGLHPPGDDMPGVGKATFWERSDRSDLKVEARGIADEVYSLKVCEDIVGEIEVTDGEGSIEFRTPGIDSKPLLSFVPTDCLFNILLGDLLVLTSGDSVLAEKHTGPHGDHGDRLEIKAYFTNTGAAPDAVGEAEFVMDFDDTAFTVHLKNLALGSYSLKVMDVEKAVFEVVEEDEGVVKLKFTDPHKDDTLLLDFDPREQVIEVLMGGEVILDLLFPDA
jgi:hypothetical protein